MLNPQKHIPKLPKHLLIPTVLILSSLFITVAFMNCKLDPEALDNNNVNNQQSSILEPANYQNIVNELASQYSNDLNEACISFYFLDQVVEALRAKDVNFGYSCQQGDCENISRDSVSFYKGSQTDTQKDLSNVFVIKVIDNVCEDNADPSAAWNIESEDTVSKWQFPRMSGSQETNSINTDSNCSPENNEVLLQELSTTYSQDFSTSCQDTQDWSFIDRALDRLYSNDNLWGYFCIDGDCNNLSTNTIAYNCGTDNSALSISIIKIIDCDQDSPQITWIDDTQNLIDTDPDAEVGWRYPRTIYKNISQIVANLREPQSEENSQDLASLETSPTTTITQKIIGRCGNTENSCAAGNFHNHPEDNSTHYRWTCRSIPHTSPNREVTCSHPKSTTTTIPQPTTTIPQPTRVNTPINGVCNNAIKYGCVAGTATSSIETSTHYRWQCSGLNGGTTATNCQKVKPTTKTSINGACDNTVNGGCLKGTFIHQPDTTTHFKWQCAGLNGGTNDNCSKIIPINGSCSVTVKNGCNQGTFIDRPDITTHYMWHCAGSKGGSSVDCSRLIPTPAVNGKCGSNHYNCTVGKAVGTHEGPSKWTWRCFGKNGGLNAHCAEGKPKAPPEDGSCQPYAYGCTRGTSVGDYDGPNYWSWRCFGLNGGLNVHCAEAKPEAPPQDGSCQPYAYGCTRGRATNTKQTNSGWTWTCQGLNGGQSASCSDEDPIIESIIEN